MPTVSNADQEKKKYFQKIASTAYYRSVWNIINSFVDLWKEIESTCSQEKFHKFHH